MNTHAINSIVQTCMAHVAHLGPKGWFVCFVATLILGVGCVRGFGSRSSF